MATADEILQKLLAIDTSFNSDDDCADEAGPADTIPAVQGSGATEPTARLLASAPAISGAESTGVLASKEKLEHNATPAILTPAPSAPAAPAATVVIAPTVPATAAVPAAPVATAPAVASAKSTPSARSSLDAAQVPEPAQAVKKVVVIAPAATDTAPATPTKSGGSASVTVAKSPSISSKKMVQLCPELAAQQLPVVQKALPPQHPNTFGVGAHLSQSAKALDTSGLVDPAAKAAVPAIIVGSPTAAPLVPTIQGVSRPVSRSNVSTSGGSFSGTSSPAQSPIKLARSLTSSGASENVTAQASKDTTDTKPITPRKSVSISGAVDTPGPASAAVATPTSKSRLATSGAASGTTLATKKSAGATTAPASSLVSRKSATGSAPAAIEGSKPSAGVVTPPVTSPTAQASPRSSKIRSRTVPSSTAAEEEGMAMVDQPNRSAEGTTVQMNKNLSKSARALDKADNSVTLATSSSYRSSTTKTPQPPSSPAPSSGKTEGCTPVEGGSGRTRRGSVVLGQLSESSTKSKARRASLLLPTLEAQRMVGISTDPFLSMDQVDKLEELSRHLGIIPTEPALSPSKSAPDVEWNPQPSPTPDSLSTQQSTPEAPRAEAP